MSVSVAVRFGVSLWVLAVLVFPAACIAGQQPTLRENKYNFEQIAVLSKALERQLAASRARVAIVARVGLNPELLPPGVQFSHTAIAVYSKVRTGDGRMVPGYAIHNLYQGAERSGVSFLAQDYPVDYLAVAQLLKTGVIIPDERLQTALLALIATGNHKTLHNDQYSVVSNPHSNLFQNCTEFVLDTIFAALYKTLDTSAIKANVKAWFKPQAVEIPRARLAMAASVMPDLRLEDHGEQVATTSFSSIVRFMQDNELLSSAFILNVNPTTLHVKRQEIPLRASS